jgi:hypothetical protein
MTVMNAILVILIFWGGIIFLFGLGWLIGYLLKLDKSLEKMEMKRK